MEMVGLSDICEIGGIEGVGGSGLGAAGNSPSLRTELFWEDGRIGSLRPRERPMAEEVGVGGSGCCDLYCPK